MRGPLRAVLFVTLSLLATSAEARRTYTIREGDVPGVLPGKFAPTLQELRDANPTVSLDTLRLGDKVVDPRPEQADLERAEQKIGGLESKLASVTAERDSHAKRIKALEGLTGELDGRVKELEPTAAQAESYRDRFQLWTRGLGGALVLAFVIIGLQRRGRKRLSRKLSDAQRELASARNEGMKAAAGRVSTFNRTDEAARPNGAAPHVTHH